jgi:hypothetical protein
MIEKRCILYGVRASSVLYQFLKETKTRGLWILPANVCPIVPAVFHKAGKKFLFCDISPFSHCIDEDSVIEILEKHRDRIAGILHVRAYGAAVDPKDLFIRAKKISEGVQLIDDRCLCQPEFEWPESVADLVLYSTGYAKYVELGKGGWGFLREKHEMEITPERFSPEAHDMLLESFRESLERGKPFNYRNGDWLDTGLSALSFFEYRKLVSGKIPEIQARKLRLNEIYSEHLGDFAFPEGYNGWRYNVTCLNPEEVVSEAFRIGLFASRHYKSLVPAFGQGRAPNASHLSDRVVNLFNDHRMEEDSAEALAKALKKKIKGLC